MIKLRIPGHKDPWELQYLVLDLNGTLALDGKLLPGVKERIITLAKDLDIYILTADTFGTAAGQFKDLPCRLQLLTFEDQIRQKEDFIKRLGPEHGAAIGNGMNDRGMLQAAKLAICITGPEGAASGTMQAADIVITDITAALDLLIHVKRLTATLRK